MRTTPVPLGDEIITISKMVKFDYDDQKEDDQFDEDKVTVKAGTYCLDSFGRIWRLDPEMSELFLGFDAYDPQLRAERAQARAKAKTKKRSRRATS